MTLHVALDCIDDVGKTIVIEKLEEYFSDNSYSVKSLLLPNNNSIISILKDYNLTIPETAMLMAVDRSITWNFENYEEFDVVLWEGSVLDSYVNHTNKTVKSSFIRTINKYFPDMNCYIVIRADDGLNYNQDSIRKYDNLIRENNKVHGVNYLPDDPKKAVDEIVKIIFRELPTCSWCGRLFTKSVFNKKYCSDSCKAYAKEEQNRDNFRNYYNRYKDTMSESRKGALGSKGANLHGKANTDPEVELKLINREKMRLGLN